MGNWLDRQMTAVRHDPGRIQVEDGIPGQDSRIFRILLEAVDTGDGKGALRRPSVTLAGDRKIDQLASVTAPEGIF